MVTTHFMGLKVWNLTTDPYDHAQLAENWEKVDEHTHSGGLGKQIPTGGIEDGAITSAKLAPGVLSSPSAGSITADQLTSGVAAYMGLSQTGSVRRGLTSITTEETTTSATPVALTTHDRVSSVVVPASGLLRIAYRAQVKRSLSGSASVYLYIGGTQAVLVSGTVGTAYSGATNAAYTNGGSSIFTIGTSAGDDPIFIPSIYAQEILVEATPGVLDVEVRWSVTAAATLSVKNRKLFVVGVDY